MKVTKVAVTGLVASGKSALCQFLDTLGAVTVSADQIVHHLLLHDQDIHQKLERLLGADVFVGGKPSREKIAEKVFGNREKLEALEALLHPKVFNEIDRCFSETKDCNIFVAEIPLLFEAGADETFDQTVTVIRSSSASDITHFEERVARQLSSKEKANRSSIVLLNRGSLDDLKKEASLLFRILLEH